MIFNTMANLEKAFSVFKERSPKITPNGLTIHVNIHIVLKELNELGMATIHEVIPIKMAIKER
jgi:hypothetical protein